MPHKYCIPKFFVRREISCDQLPEHVYRRAKEIIEKLEDGAHFQFVDGKRMDFDKSKICIPIGRRYRMFAGLNMKQIDVFVFCPALQSLRDQLRTVKRSGVDLAATG